MIVLLTKQSSMCFLFFSLSLSTKLRYRDVTMRVVTFWGQERGYICLNFYISSVYRLLIQISICYVLLLFSWKLCFFLNVSPGPLEKTINVSHNQKKTIKFCPSNAKNINKFNFNKSSFNLDSWNAIGQVLAAS